MRKYWPLLPVAAILLAGAAVAVPARAAASQHPYRLVDPGTFGGPQSFLNLPAVPLTSNGALLGTADTATHDADYPKCNPFMVGFPDRYLVHAFAWRGGRLHDLGALPGNNSSAVFEVNGSGVGAGMSETAITDPHTGWPADHAVMFKGGKVTDLGTLPGGFESQANDINDHGQVSGFASNGIRDKYSFFKVFGGPGPCGPSGWGTQARSFAWQSGVMRDIGTLGGPDAVMTTQNATGQITGQSWTSSTPNPATGIPTLDPFLWAGGHMRDLGTLGGTIGFANWLNDRGEVVGVSDLAADQTAHPFLWANGHMRDLGTLGGDFGFANSVNERGFVVGGAQAADQNFHGFLWRNGKMHDLPPVGGAPWAFANSVNDHGQVAGNDNRRPRQRTLRDVVERRPRIQPEHPDRAIKPAPGHRRIHQRRGRDRRPWRAPQRQPARLPADPQPLGAAAAGRGQVGTRAAGRPAATPWAPVRHHAAAGPLLGDALPGSGISNTTGGDDRRAGHPHR